MTSPRTPGGEPGESEFCWGRGLQAPEERGYVPTPFEQMKAQQRVRPEEDVSADYAAEADTAANKTRTRWVRESGPSRR